LASKNITYVLVNWDAIARFRNTYGFTDFVQPGLFDRLVRQNVLAPLPPIRGFAQQVYRVVQPPAKKPPNKGICCR
jgi:hypothetical protein